MTPIKKPPELSGQLGARTDVMVSVRYESGLKILKVIVNPQLLRWRLIDYQLNLSAMDKIGYIVCIVYFGLNLRKPFCFSGPLFPIGIEHLIYMKFFCYGSSYGY